MNSLEMIEVIDSFLKELGTTGLVDAKKARDQLMDLRLMLMKDGPVVPDDVSSIVEVKPEFL